MILGNEVSEGNDKRIEEERYHNPDAYSDTRPTSSVSVDKKNKIKKKEISKMLNSTDTFVKSTEDQKKKFNFQINYGWTHFLV